MTKKSPKPMTDPAAKRIEKGAAKKPTGKAARDKFPKRAKAAASKNK